MSEAARTACRFAGAGAGGLPSTRNAPRAGGGVLKVALAILATYESVEFLPTAAPVLLI